MDTSAESETLQLAQYFLIHLAACCNALLRTLGCGPTLEEAKNLTDELSVHVSVAGGQWLGEIKSNRVPPRGEEMMYSVDSLNVWSLTSRAVALTWVVSNRSQSA